MGDGVKLAVDIYRPARVSGARPFSRSRNPAVSPARFNFARKDPRPRGWGTLANEFARALWFSIRLCYSCAPSLPLAAIAFSVMRSILFVPVRGNASTNVTSTGRLYLTRFCLQ
jgi:hypothetical protein